MAASDSKGNLNQRDLDRSFMEQAIELATRSRSEDERTHPKVGAVVVKDNEVRATAFRGEEAGRHAEFTALERVKDEVLSGSTVYTTLEPCITRSHPKLPCARRLIERRVARVVIGMLDPNPRICGRGQRMLREAGIVTEFFDGDLMSSVEELNRDFTRSHELPVVGDINQRGVHKPNQF